MQSQECDKPLYGSRTAGGALRVEGLRGVDKEQRGSQFADAVNELHEKTTSDRTEQGSLCCTNVSVPSPPLHNRPEDGG